MEREPRKKTYATKKVKPRSKRARGGSFSNLGGANEDLMVRPFPTQIEFGHEGQRKKYEQLLSRKFVPNRYMSAHALREVGLFEEVNMYITRMGWEACVLLQYPTYVRLTCEFLSSFHFDEQALLITFRLGNIEYTMGLFELNNAYNFPSN